MMAIPTLTCNLQVLALQTEHKKVNTLLYINSDDYTSVIYVNKASYSRLSFFIIITTTNAVLNVRINNNIYLASPILCPLQDLYIA